MPVVEARDLTKRYGARDILSAVSLALDAGDSLLLRGRSGSGKSTLIHLLAGIERPTSGTVLLGGDDLGSLEARDLARARLERIGLVFQHFNLIPDLTAEENVRLPLVLAKREGRKARAPELLARVGLADKVRAFPSSLSGGEMQRVAIARALANEPGLILADEPTANLDETNALLVLDLLESLAAEGRAVLVASHDALALKRFRRQMQLREGKLAPL